ncbi:MAG: undecaprenyl-diphosphate phosphatase, partial [Myxococcota bacterium]
MPGADLGVVEALVLGVLQGLTEFLPVSSSGHVALGALLFGLRDAPLSLEVVLHLGTLAATLVVFGRDALRLAAAALRALGDAEARKSEDARMALAVVVGTLPTVVIGLGMKDAVEAWKHLPAVVGVCLLVSAAACLATRVRSGEGEVPTLRQAFLIGVAQGLAVLPGLSRSGSTIAVAMLLGLRGEASFRFSFLLSLPAIAGASLLVLGEDGALDQLPPSVWVGGAVSLFVGLGALWALRGIVLTGRFWLFALYLVPAGLLA